MAEVELSAGDWLPATRYPLPATATPLRVDSNGQREKKPAERNGEKLETSSWLPEAEKQQAAGSGQPAVKQPVATIPRALWLNESLKTIDVIREIWEIEDEWWRDHIARRYFDVILDGGKHLVIYQDRLTGKWFAQTP